MRTDLLALTDDDLASLTNLGSVRRARREVHEDRLGVQLNEDAQGTVTARWVDGPQCSLPGGKVLADGRCSCPAVGTICRHLLRTVIAYQAHHAAAAPTVVDCWDPGAIADADLIAAVSEPALKAARAALSAGLLAEVVRSRKPVVRFIGLDVAVRFLVPRDLRYATTDLEGGERARFIALAVLVCRELPPDRVAGLVVVGATGRDPAHVPLIAEHGCWLNELLLLGTAGTPSAVLDRGRALEEPLRRAGLHALADLTHDLVLQLQRYQRHDALFAAEEVAELAGEALIRSRVIAVPCAEVPASLVRGSAVSSTGERDTGRFVGLGCRVRFHRRGVVLSAVMQDSDTGSLAVVTREQSDPEDGKPVALDQLAALQFSAGISLHGLAHGTLQSPSCRRETGGRIILGRGRHGLSPQGYAWERLRDPVLVEDFAELRARLQALPPACLRSRSAAGDVAVLAVHAADVATYDRVAQAWCWTITDAAGESCAVSQVFASRAQAGFAALGTALRNGDRQLYVSAEVRLRAGRLVARPLAVVFANDQGRYAVMPWCDPLPSTLAADDLPLLNDAGQGGRLSVLSATERVLQEALINGLDRGASLWERTVRDAAVIADAGGQPRLAQQLRRLQTCLLSRRDRMAWDPTEAIALLRDLLQWYRLRLDLG